MTLEDLLDSLNIEIANRGDVYPVLEAEIEIHTQHNYPLKGGIENVRMLNGTLAIATRAMSEYGDQEAWEWEDY